MTLTMSEADLQSAVIDLAKLRGYLCYHTHDSRRSAPGFPDLVFARRDRLVFAELKSDKGRLSDAQSKWLATLVLFGAEVHIWRPADLRSGLIAALLR